MNTDKTITFKTPVSAGGITYESIDLREPTGREMAKFFKDNEKHGGWEAGMALVATIAGVDVEVLQRAPASNVQEAIDHCANFLNSGEETGGRSGDG